jgi:hypothetical protein
MRSRAPRPRPPDATARALRPRPLGAAIAIVLLSVAFPGNAARPAPAATPEEGARSFYAKVVALKARGVPDRAQQRQLAPTISSALAAALRTAGDAEQRHRKATGNREPPLWEGDVFSSLFEGPTEASVDRCHAEGDHAQCVVSLSYRDYFGGSHRWNDRAILVRERGRWVVDDVGYEARWAFGNKGMLRENLRAATAQAPKDGGGKPSASGKGSRARGR